MKKVLHIAPTPFFADRGCHIRIEGIVRCLDQLGHTNTVCTYHHGRDLETVSTRRIKPIKTYTQTAAGPSKYKLWADWRLLWLVFREYRISRPDVIHAHLHEGLLIGIIVKILLFWRSTPLIADMQGSLTGELDSHGSFQKLPFLKPLTHLLERLLMWFPNAIICSSRHSLEKLQTEFNIASDKISLAQDGADEFASSAEHAHTLREKYKVPDAATLVVYSGALLESKGLAELQEVIRQLANEEIHFLIIGYPTEELEEYLRTEDLLQNCNLTGQVDFSELPKLLSGCDIAIDPKHSDAGEGSGKMLNYLTCALPVVAFNTANNREFLPAGTKLAENTADLANLILELGKNPEARTKLAAASLQHFSQNYSWNVTRAQLESAYRKFD